ncbi:MAG: hypothetical protein QGE97_06360 [SAR324 cluster bacterium]|nr:hypothetical protein [SAR324 cluster bacterium]
MAKKRYKPEEIVIKLRQVEVLQSQGLNEPPGSTKGPPFDT